MKPKPKFPGLMVHTNIAGGWSVRARGKLRAWKNFPTKKEALAFARDKRQRIYLMRRNGMVDRVIG